MKDYNIITDYQHDPKYREMFHIFIENIFPSISFRNWYDKGFWTDQYKPFSMVEDGKIISSACVAFMDVFVNGEKKKAIQLGAVGTLPEYRNKALSRKLIEYILEKFKDQVEFFSLYANDSVLDFYPKFGFERIEEYEFIKESEIPEADYSARKLDIEKDYDLIKDFSENRQPLTKIFGAENHSFVSMWHIISHYKDMLYYLEQEDVIVIKEEKNRLLTIVDVLFKKTFDLDKALSKLIESENIKSVNYLFPADQLAFSFDKTKKVDTYFFVKGNLNLPENPFRFPVNAIT